MEKKKLIIFLIFVFSVNSTAFAMNYGQTISNMAWSVRGKPYALANPPNEWSCPGGHFDFSNWTINNGFDCSGLLSWAADLRRRYLASDFINEFSNSVSWNNLSAGDFLYTRGVSGTVFPNPHILIFVKMENSKYKIVHAGSSGVVDRTYTLELLRDTWGFAPYRLILDNTAADITITGVTDGGVYSSATTIFFQVQDTVNPVPCGKFYLNNTLEIHDRSGHKTVSDESSHTLNRLS